MQAGGKHFGLSYNAPGWEGGGGRRGNKERAAAVIVQLGSVYEIHLNGMVHQNPRTCMQDT